MALSDLIVSVCKTVRGRLLDVYKNVFIFCISLLFKL